MENQLTERLRGYKSTPRHAEELCAEAANEIDALRALVRRQLQWQKHRDSVGIVMSGAECAWIADAEAALASNKSYATSVDNP